MKTVFGGLLFCLSLSIFVCFISWNLYGQVENRKESIENVLEIWKDGHFTIHGYDINYPEWRNRILIPAILYYAEKIKLFTLEQWYLIIRLITSFIAFYSFWYFAMKLAHADPIVAGFGTGLLAYMVIITFEVPYSIPTDFPEITFFIIILWATLRRRKTLLFIISILSSINRESGLFACILWVLLNGTTRRFKPLWREFIYAGSVLFAGLATTNIVRNIITGSNGIIANYIMGPKSFVLGLKKFYENPHIFSRPCLAIVLVLPVILWIVKNRNKLDFELQRLLLSAVVMAIISGYVGIFFEFRVYIPIYVILAFVAIAAESLYRTQQE